MNYEEIRELDAWISEHVFGAKCGHVWSVESGQSRCKKCNVQWDGKEVVMPYSKDPSAAMEVLKKCIEGRTVVIGSPSQSEYLISWLKSDSIYFHTKAETFELAICLFAKKIFTK